MEFHVERALKLANTAEMRDLHSRKGGSFIVYERCVSFLIYSALNPKLVWVAPYESRRGKGLVFSLSSFLFGWWSFGGILNTLLALVHNLLGGFDLTATILDPNTRDGELRWELQDIGRTFQSRRFAIFVVWLIVLLLFGLPLAFYLLIDVLPRWAGFQGSR